MKTGKERQLADKKEGGGERKEANYTMARKPGPL
jgi:hypothetical protein